MSLLFAFFILVSCLITLVSSGRLHDLVRDADVSGLNNYIQKSKEEKDIINVEDENEYGDTALIVASEKGYSEIVTILIRELGANVNAINNMNTTALHFAAYEGHLSVVEILVKNGADPYSRAKDEWFVLTVVFNMAVYFDLREFK